MRGLGMDRTTAVAMMLRDRHPAPRLSQAGRSWPHTSSRLTSSLGMPRTSIIMAALLDELADRRPAYRIEAEGDTHLGVISLHLDLERRMLRNTAWRTWRLMATIQQRVAQRAASSWVVLVVVGHLCHVAMVQRVLLSTLSEVWAFSRRPAPS